MKVPPFGLTTEQIVDELRPLRRDLSVAVVRAKNPFNVGAIIRVAHSFLVREIFLIGDAPYYERGSMGMHKYETIVECPTEAAFLERVRSERRPLVGVERDHARLTLWEAELPGNVVLTFGSEDDGLPPEILDACDQVIAIPMYGINHSFPLTVACGIVLAEWARRHDPRGSGSRRT
ncbi:MAG: TrmH family RNA methyltransferase [Deltaproteobacteria bacterium]|nr:TrmH family RNA methyltransferase [Deltaproteobacteria bacterium]